MTDGKEQPRLLATASPRGVFVEADPAEAPDDYPFEDEEEGFDDESGRGEFEAMGTAAVRRSITQS